MLVVEDVLMVVETIKFELPIELIPTKPPAPLARLLFVPVGTVAVYTRLRLPPAGISKEVDEPVLTPPSKTNIPVEPVVGSDTALVFVIPLDRSKD